MYYKHNTQTRSRNHCCCGIATIITCSQYVFRNLSFQHPKDMSPIVLSSVSCLAITFFSYYLTNGKIFGKKLLKLNFL
jgi:hypothetical protein